MKLKHLNYNNGINLKLWNMGGKLPQVEPRMNEFHFGLRPDTTGVRPRSRKPPLRWRHRRSKCGTQGTRQTDPKGAPGAAAGNPHGSPSGGAAVAAASPQLPLCQGQPGSCKPLVNVCFVTKKESEYQVLYR